LRVSYHWRSKSTLAGESWYVASAQACDLFCEHSVRCFDRARLPRLSAKMSEHEAEAGLYSVEACNYRCAFTSQPISCGTLQGHPWLAAHATSCRVTLRAKQAAAARLRPSFLSDLVVVCLKGLMSAALTAPKGGLLALHRHKEFVVGFGVFKFIQQEFDGGQVFHAV
jgi:hypothetical protein